MPSTFASSLALALLVTALIESTVAWIYAYLRKLPCLPLAAVQVLASAATLPGLWLFMQWAGNQAYWTALLTGEVVVWLVEAAVLYSVLRKTIRWWDALVLAFIANLVSFLVGLGVRV